MANNRYDYFAYFAEVAQTAKQQAILLEKTVLNYDETKIQELIQEMHSLEHAADEKKKEMMETLIRDFLPPLDFEEITDLSESLDDVCDQIDDVMMHFYMYNISSIRDDVSKITGKIIEITTDLEALCHSIKGLKNPEQLLGLVRAINDQEEVGDRYYLEAVHNLYSDYSLTFHQICGWENLYHGLENCFDACESAANVVRNILIRHS